MIDSLSETQRKITKSDLENFPRSSKTYEHDIGWITPIFLSEGCYFLTQESDLSLLIRYIGNHLLLRKAVQPYLERLATFVWQLTLKDDGVGCRVTCRVSDEKSIFFSKSWEDSCFHEGVEPQEIEIWCFPYLEEYEQIRWVLKLSSEC